ncbi:MAG TPA: leucine ABC transporter subunit substrate-binding protein LivK, partial [Rubrivivax sp.]|nr:leucine ABC transporter subunit substrate-binding protein LivK [Rubrivivax sp.]
AFKDKNRNAGGAFQLTSFAAAQSLVAAIKAVGDDPAKVADYLHKSTVDTVIGPISWNKQGDLNSFQFDVFTWHKDGSKTLATK